MNPDVRAELAPSGTLRAGINLANFLLVTGRTPDGDPEGVAPDMAAEIARRLDVPIAYVPFDTPAKLADAAGDDVWDIGLIGAEPARAETIAFTAAYTEIEATYLVPAGSALGAVEEVDRDGVRIAVAGGSAYDLFLSRSLEHAELVRASGLDGSFDLFVEQKLDALAGLRPRLISDVERLPGARILDGRFTAVQQAVGTPRPRERGAAFLREVRRGREGERTRAAPHRPAPRPRPFGGAGRRVKENGALQVVECRGDDVPEGETTSFPMAVKCEPDETVVFSWIVWPSREVRDAAHAAMMSDSRLAADLNPMPFEGKRLIYGGFEMLIEE